MSAEHGPLLRASPVFVVVVLIALAILGFFGAVVVAGLLGLNASAQAMGHFSERSHRIHDLTFASLFGTAAVGLLAQLVSPSRNIAGQLLALVPWLALALMFPLTSFWSAPGGGFVIVATALLGTLTLNAAIFHPTGTGLIRSLRVSRIDRSLLALVLVAAVPLLGYAATNIGLQANPIKDAHAAAGHYGFMAAFSFTVIGVGSLTGLRPDGWRLTAWVAGALPGLLGLSSLAVPDVSSSLEPVWAIASIAWGIVFIAAAERSLGHEDRC